MSDTTQVLLKVVSAGLAATTLALWYLNKKQVSDVNDVSSGVAFRLKDRTVVAQKQPYPTKVEAGKTYYWCSCGRSKSQPFCDGSHDREKTGLKPVKYVADKDDTVYFCGCKQTDNQPFCDGTHSKIK